jgi:curved DNA-binding protein CbpA
VTQNQNPQSTQRRIPTQTRLVNSYYGLLGLQPSASATDIRKAYHRLSKLYHPDTTELPEEIARGKFQRLNEAYATLSNPDRRSNYDLKIGYLEDVLRQKRVNYGNLEDYTPKKVPNSAYIDSIDRPLSAGEISVIFFLGATIGGCLILVIVIAYLRGMPL